MSLIDALERWDGEQLVLERDLPTGAWIIVAIHSTRLGPAAAGGTRMAVYPDLDAALSDALRLSAAMTGKLALADLPYGGGKAVIALPRTFERVERECLLQRYGALLGRLGGRFVTGPDMGTTAEDMDFVARGGAPRVHCCTPEAGGAGGSGPATAVGVLAAITWILGRMGRELRGARVLVQGVGGVGRPLVRLLLEEGAEVLASDTDPAALAGCGARPVPPELAIGTPCDVFAPCAAGGVLSAQSIPLLACRAVVGAANNQLATEEDAGRLERRGMLYAPDSVTSLGGCLAGIGIEQLGWSREQALNRIRETVARRLEQVFDLAESEGISTHAAALRLVEQKLAGCSPPGC